MLQLLKEWKISVWGMVFIMAVGWCIVASNGFAEDAAESTMKIKEIKQPPFIETANVQQEMPIEPSYFITGTVAAMGDDWITINDHQLFIAPDASIGCGVGDFIGIKVNDERQAISCERIRSK